MHGYQDTGRSRDTNTKGIERVYAQHACFSFRATLVTRMIGLFLRNTVSEEVLVANSNGRLPLPLLLSITSSRFLGIGFWSFFFFFFLASRKIEESRGDFRISTWIFGKKYLVDKSNWILLRDVCQAVFLIRFNFLNHDENCTVENSRSLIVDRCRKFSEHGWKG